MPLADCKRYDSLRKGWVSVVSRDLLMEAIGSLGLYGMNATFNEILAAGIRSRATPAVTPQSELDFQAA